MRAQANTCREAKMEKELFFHLQSNSLTSVVSIRRKNTAQNSPKATDKVLTGFLTDHTASQVW